MSPSSRVDVVPLDPFDAAALDAWHHVYLLAEQHDLGAAATPWQVEEVRVMMQDTGSHSWLAGWRGVVDGETVAAGWLRASLLDNLEHAEVTVHVLPSHRRRGIGTVVLRAVEAAAHDGGRLVLTGQCGWRWDLGSEGGSAAGPAFARTHGYELALSEVQRELRLPVPGRQLSLLAEEAAREHPAYTLRSWVGPVPDDLLRGWAELTSTLVTEAPTGELQVEPEAVSPEAVREREATTARQGRTKYNTVALTSSGEVVAYTDLATTVHEPDRAYQWGTLVHGAHRGHRLGLGVKVANLRLLQRERPDLTRLTTYNAEVNSHMIGVNEVLGFRPVGRYGSFQKRLR